MWSSGSVLPQWPPTVCVTAPLQRHEQLLQQWRQLWRWISDETLVAMSDSNSRRRRLTDIGLAAAAARAPPVMNECDQQSSETELAWDDVIHTNPISHYLSAAKNQLLQRVRIARNADHCTSYRILSVCPSVCTSVTLRYCVQTNEDTIGFQHLVGQSL